MLQKMGFFFGALLASSTLVPSANAEPIYDGVTFAELTSALQSGGGLNVRADKVDDVDILYAEGKYHMIGVQLVHCGKDNRCDGVRYYAPLQQVPSDAFVKQFNWDHDYSKIVFTAKGTPVLSNELMTIGGVTAKNIYQNALSLMYRITQFNEEIAKTSSYTPSPARTASASRSRVDEERTSLTAGAPPLQFDTRAARAIVEQVKPIR